MSFSTNKFSPLDGIRSESDKSAERNTRISDIISMRDRNGSVVSFDSVKTTERLLDKLDLSAEDEMLLQQALKEDEARRKQLEGFPQRRVVCMPASGFPSLRKPSGSNGNLNLENCEPLMNIINELSEKDRIKLSKRADVKLFLPKSRFSYLVEEESDEESNPFHEDNLCFNGRAVNVEKFRLENYAEDPKLGFGNSATEEHIPFNIIPERPALKLHSKSSVQTPVGSLSSIETRYLIKPSTQSSTESETSRSGDGRNKISESPPSWKFSTPRKSTSSTTVNKDSFSPTKTPKSNHGKGHKKKPSFSFKNLFKSPRVDDESSTAKSAGQQYDDTPPTNRLEFSKQIEEGGPQSFYTNAPASVSTDSPRSLVSSRRFLPHHSRAASDTKIRYASANQRSGLKDTVPSKELKPKHVLHPIKTSMPELPLVRDGRPLSPESRIRVAIDLRNRGFLKESAEHLKVLCEASNPTGYLLFGLALRYGSGIERNFTESLRYLKKAASVKDEDSEVLKVDMDPFKLTDVPHVSPEPLAPALHECGISYLKGYGVGVIDELKAIKYLELAASKGHVDSMCLSGTIWSKSSKIRRKNKARAAAWFRLADRRGADLIGADWIYKDKYQNASLYSL
ncbi:LAQU0S06e02674g1_1 [Lachancea quebecensis]|uniref:LAQU0S06e02674g1_1 n=1 Tax=Lachancea quebecensis TaxID=1654605 RepID=A0A0P1KU24_9SACH|nr:LAQU0S06e02674g1_1 [Lachancea quebecensis]